MTQLLRARGYLPVAEICRRFNVSEATARRDLVALAGQKTVVRTFGGALADYERRFTPFSDRLNVAARAKAKIGAAAVEQVSPGMTVFIDAGTTLFALANLLRRRPMQMRIVTHSLAVAECLSNVREIQIDLLGGRLVANQSVLLGDETLWALRRYRFDWAFLGVEAFNEEAFWNSSDEVVAVQRAVVERAEHHAVCADAGKLNAGAPALLLKWPDLDTLITNLPARRLPVRFERIITV